MNQYNEDTFIQDIANSEMAKKAKKHVSKFQPSSIWNFIKALLLGIGKAVLFAPLHVTVFPIINAWKRSR
tara:strand:- start:54 stop:263 length:210 start_codon:yes stop_codon:yes gene_type:complete